MVKPSKRRDTITIDGSSGKVFMGEIPAIEPKMTQDFRTVLEWAQNPKKLELGPMLILRWCKTCQTIWGTGYRTL